MNRKQQLKKELKELAVELRKLKSERKSHDNGYVPGMWRAKYDARHKHIAYCMLRGKTYEQIERSCHEKANMSYVEKLMENVDEPKDVCASEEGSDTITASSTGGSRFGRILNKLLG